MLISCNENNEQAFAHFVSKLCADVYAKQDQNIHGV